MRVQRVSSLLMWLWTVLACLHGRLCAHAGKWSIFNLRVSTLLCPVWLCPPDHLLFWNVHIVRCVFRQADIGSPIIGYSVVREKSLFIGPLSGASVHLALETFLTCYAARVILASKAAEWWQTQERLSEYQMYMMYQELTCLYNVLSCFETALIYI